VTSDHGNMEDMSVKSHTHNPVPALIWGPEAGRLAAGVKRLEDFAALFLDAAGVDRMPDPGERPVS
jgi:2,3-bisphosphoglycerate-independent phosphoglycerate mutase